MCASDRTALTSVHVIRGSVARQHELALVEADVCTIVTSPVEFKLTNRLIASNAPQKLAYEIWQHEYDHLSFLLAKVNSLGAPTISCPAVRSCTAPKTALPGPFRRCLEALCAGDHSWAVA